MRQIKITVCGLTPALLNNISSMNSETSVKQVSYDPAEEARKRLYWTDDKSSLAIPGVAFYRSFIKAAGNYKVGKLKMSTAMIGCVAITPEFVSLNTTEYKIDTRSVVIQKNRVPHSRPKIWPWEVTFELHFRDEWIPIPIMQKFGPQIIKTAGVLNGVCDFRPEKKGPFGQYYLKRFELLPQREEAFIPEPEIVGFDSEPTILEEKKSKKRKAA
jgi:hypothetical protein